LLLAPTLAILTVFLYYPLLETFRLSTLLARLGAPRTRFQCVSNFTSLISPEYGEVLFNTFFIATTIVVVGLILGLAIALLAFQPVRGANIYRTLLIWPYAISPAIAGIIFFVMFDPVAGIINHFIEQLGGTGLEWIRDPWLARFAVIITSIWKTLGYNILFYIAGLQTIPSNLLEAAAIDGANLWQRFLNIIVPGLSPITFFLIVTNITYAFFNIFGTIDYLTRGGPAGATSVSIYEIYLLGIRSKDLGRAAAQSLVLFLLVVIVTILQFRTSGRRVSYGA
jgi:sn-glycerol 3-phosphate transport system permease protein